MDLNTDQLIMPLEALEPDSDLLALANYTEGEGNGGFSDNGYLPHEKIAEGLMLMFVGIVGILLNLLVLILTLGCSNLRIMMNGFTVHGCFVDIFKSALCIPFSLTLLTDKLPNYCEIIGTAYVIMQTAGLFNLLAMVLAEAYTFHVHNLNEKDQDRQGAVMCVLFGIIMIYTGSLIIHLGPTLIGGHFQFNEDIGNCIFAYGQIKSYIVQCMWIGIVTLTFAIIFRYILKFYRLLKANEQFRITALARNAAAMSQGQQTSESIYDIVYRLKKKVRVLTAMSVITLVCWYPLFAFTITDLHYTRPRYLYRILTVIAWSHSALIPLPLLVMDKSFGVWFQFKRMMMQRKQEMNASPDVKRRLLSNQSRESSAHPTPNHFPKKMQMVTNYTGNERGNNSVKTSLAHQNSIKSHISNSTPPQSRRSAPTSPPLNHIIREPHLNHVIREPKLNSFMLANHDIEKLSAFPVDFSDVRTSSNYDNKRNSYGTSNSYGTCSVHNSPAMSHRSGMLYDKLTAELHTVGARLPSPDDLDDTLRARVNQSRETDLLCDDSPEYDPLP